MKSPSSFLPKLLFEKFPELDQNYMAVIDWTPLHDDIPVTKDTIDMYLPQIKDLLIHSFVLNQNNDWVFITQIEVYIKNKDLDDVAIITKHDEKPDMLSIEMKQYQNEGSGSWYEIRFLFMDIEVIATGGLSQQKDNKLEAFLGVAAPAKMAANGNYILFAPTKAAESQWCIRMLRDYSKRESLKPWCCKSAFFVQNGFYTPLPLQFHENDIVDYASICSKLIYLMANKAISTTEIGNLEVLLNKIQYWKDLGFKRKVAKERILKKLEEIKKIKIAKNRKPSESKRLLIEVIIGYSDEQPIRNRDATILYNGLLYSRVKTINNRRVKEIMKL